jgi:prolyl 4-hydroxylase
MHTVTAFGYSPHVLAVQQFVRRQGGATPTAAIRQLVQALPRFPAVSMLDIRDVLHALGTPVTIVRSRANELPSLALPLITSLTGQDGKFFVVLTEGGPGQVVYYVPDRGEVAEPWDRFLAQWQEALVLLPVGIAPLAGYPEADEELAQARRYQGRDLRTLDDFLTPQQCRHIVTCCESQSLFNQSTVENRRTAFPMTAVRSSYSAHLTDQTDPVLNEIYRKVAALLDVPENWIEPLQCVKYSPRQEYRPHYDSNEVNLRKHTLFVYLNDDFERGETYFPELHLQVKPRQGRAVYFLNRDSDNNLIPFSVHAGLPVQTGIKYGCNIWVRSSPVR